MDKMWPPFLCETALFVNISFSVLNKPLTVSEINKWEVPIAIQVAIVLKKWPNSFPGQM